MSATAKINRKHIQRSVIFVVAILVVVYAFYWLTSKHGDPDLLHPPAATVGDIAAVEETPNGSQVVIIKPDGTIDPAPGYTDGALDDHVAWRPDGGRLFFVSDRKNGEPQVYRWDPDSKLLEQRTVDNRPKGFMSFIVPGDTNAADVSSALVISGGTVLALDANSGIGTQLLPPHNKNAAAGTESSGSEDEMTRLYSNYGTSFARALYGPNKNFVVAVMNREDGGQALILQPLGGTTPQPPIGVLQAEHISIDVGKKTGQILITAQGEEVPDWLTDEQKQPFRKGDKYVAPFKHIVALFNPATSNQLTPIVASLSDDTAFGQARFSADESEVVFTFGRYSGSVFEPGGVATAPAVKMGVKNTKPLARGNFTDPSFSPDGKKILALIAGSSGKRDIVSLDDIENSIPVSITQGKGDFTEAEYSPQLSAG